MSLSRVQVYYSLASASGWSSDMTSLSAGGWIGGFIGGVVVAVELSWYGVGRDVEVAGSAGARGSRAWYLFCACRLMVVAGS